MKVRFWLIKRPLRPLAVQDPSACIAWKLASGSPSGHPPAPKRRKRARGRLSQKLWPSPGKLFREARRASPSARITERARATARVCHGCRGSFGRRPEKFFGKPNGPAPSAKITEASASDAPLPGCRGSFNRRRESFLGKPDGPDPSVKTTGTSFRAARRARPKPKPSMILRVTKNGTRRARAGFLRTLNPKRF